MSSTTRDLPVQPKPALPPARQAPTPPPMRVVEKGLWRLRETALPTQEVERQNDERQQQG